MIKILQIKWSKAEIVKKREEVANLLKAHSSNIKDDNISSISDKDLGLLFSFYDKVFFNNWFNECFKGKIAFSLSRRMTKSAGLTICPKNADRLKPEELALEIRLGIDFFFQYGSIEGSKFVCGIETDNSLDAMQLVFEHELCHMIEYIHFYKSNCKGERFKTIANNIFGHTGSYHGLPTFRQIADEKLGLGIGDKVAFEIEGKKEKGFIYNINKRATVMVKNNKGDFVDNNGNRYDKFYVPLRLLKKK